MAFEYKVRSSRYCFDPKRHGPKSKTPFAISRSKIDLFGECPRCFYIDQRHGIKRPDGYPFNLNVAVDALLKKEFDILRAEGNSHPLMDEYGIEAVPFAHKDIEVWRDSLRNGISYVDPETNIKFRGGIDDVWVNKDGALHVVDYKATSKDGQVSLDAEWQDGYKRQVEVYQWLFRKNGFTVSDTAYFVYANGDTSPDRFDARLEFDISIIPYDGDDSWIPEVTKALHDCLMAEATPEPRADCTYCTYRGVAGRYLQQEHREKMSKK